MAGTGGPSNGFPFGSLLLGLIVGAGCKKQSCLLQGWEILANCLSLKVKDWGGGHHLFCDLFNGPSREGSKSYSSKFGLSRLKGSERQPLLMFLKLCSRAVRRKHYLTPRSDLSVFGDLWEDCVNPFHSVGVAPSLEQVNQATGLEN